VKPTVLRSVDVSISLNVENRKDVIFFEKIVRMMCILRRIAAQPPGCGEALLRVLYEGR
jgi:hypothetical protein